MSVDTAIMGSQLSFDYWDEGKGGQGGREMRESRFGSETCIAEERRRSEQDTRSTEGEREGVEEGRKYGLVEYLDRYAKR